MGSSKSTKRRNDDPVRVHKDGRIWYWPSGIPGEGERLSTRPKPGQHPEVLAEELRSQVGTPSMTKGGRTLVQLLRAYMDAHDLEHPTTNTYRHRWNNHILCEVGNVKCRDLSLADLLEVADSAIAKPLAPNTVTSVTTAFQAVVTWGVERGWFNKDPFGSNKARSKAVTSALRAAFDNDMDEEGRDAFTIATVPSHEDVYRLTDYVGERVERDGHCVPVLKASGLRVAEFVGTRTEDVDLDRLVISAMRQGRRNRKWNPAAPGSGDAAVWTKRLKGRQAREVQVWEVAREDLEWLVEHAVDGWLVPPDSNQGWWLDAFNRRINNACAAVGWPEGQRCHWLRHYYGTYSIAKAPDGYDLGLDNVSRWMGHSSKQTTMDMYWHPTTTASSNLGDITSRKLGGS